MPRPGTRTAGRIGRTDYWYEDEWTAWHRSYHEAKGAVGLPELHFHDLRHTGNTMAAAQGASLKELMERMGHSSPRAALIYLHATRERDQKIAAGMGRVFAHAKKASASKSGTDPKPSGTQRARRTKTTPAGTREN